MTTGLPLPAPLSLLVEKMDQDIPFWGTGEHMLWGGMCMSLEQEKHLPGPGDG